MTDTTSMPVYKTSGDQNVLRMLGRVTCSLTWCLLCFCSTSRRRQMRRAADAVAGEWQVPVRNVSAQPPLDTYRTIYVPYHADREGLPLNTQGERRPPHFLASGLGLAEAAPRIGSPTHAASERHARRYVEQARESGSREVPKPKLVLTVKLSVDLVRGLRRYARSDHRIVSSIVAQSLEELLDRMPSVLHQDRRVEVDFVFDRLGENHLVLERIESS
jgi:hypothetical protein